MIIKLITIYKIVISESQTNEVLIMDEDEVDVDGGLEYAEAMDVDDKQRWSLRKVRQ